MKMELNNSHPGQARAHGHADSIPVGAAAVAGSTHYTCPMHPEIRSAQPSDCAICGTTLVPAAGRLFDLCA